MVRTLVGVNEGGSLITLESKGLLLAGRRLHERWKNPKRMCVIIRGLIVVETSILRMDHNWLLHWRFSNGHLFKLSRKCIVRGGDNRH